MTKSSTSSPTVATGDETPRPSWRRRLTIAGPALAVAIGVSAFLGIAPASALAPTMHDPAVVTCTSGSGRVLVQPRFTGMSTGQWGAFRIHVWTWTTSGWRYDGATPFEVLQLRESTKGGDDMSPLAGDRARVSTVGSGYKFVTAEYRYYDSTYGWSVAEYSATTSYLQQSAVSSPMHSQTCQV